MFKILSALVPVLFLIFFSATSDANDANVCRTKSLPQSNKESALSNESLFTCANGLSGTIPALAKSGWKVTNVMEQSDLTGLSSLNNSHPPSNSEDLTKTFWLMIIQKD